MPRLKNEINDKDRKTQCVLTSNSVVYKVPIGEEGDKIGHFIEVEVIDNVFVFRFATKKEANLRIEKKQEPFAICFA
jgi:hypothetical protein